MPKRHKIEHKDVDKKGTQIGHPKLITDTPRNKIPIDSGADGKKFAQVVPNWVAKPSAHK